jgi:hypothetical protein
MKLPAARGKKRPDRLPPSPGRDWLAARVEARWSLQAMATERGVSPQTVRKWLAAAGLERQPLGSTSIQQRARVDAIATPAWLAERVTVPAVDIAAELGCSDQLVYELMKAAGLDYRPTRRKHRQPVHSGECETCRLLATCKRIEAVAELLPCMLEAA